MNQYVWLFPILFILHDMEEVIGFGIWLQKNQSMLDGKYPKISKTYKDYSTEGMALAVSEELIVCILFCVLGIVTQSRYIWLLWLGGIDSVYPPFDHTYSAGNCNKKIYTGVDYQYSNKSNQYFDHFSMYSSVKM